MPELLSLTATVDWASRAATLTVRGRLDDTISALVRERLDWIGEAHPRRLVLDLRLAAGSAGGQAGALITAVQRHLPAGCLLDVRSA